MPTSIPIARGTSSTTATRRIVRLALLVIVLALVPFAAEAQTPRRGTVAADYDPSLGVRVTSPDGAVELTAPSGALNQSATFSHEALEPPGAVGGGVRLMRAFKLEAAGADRSPITHFSRPLRLVIRYTDAELAALGVRPTALRVFYQDSGSAWQPIATTVDAASRTLRADVAHFTVFAAGTAGAGDTFDRPDSAIELGTATTGQTWLTDGTIWGICGNAACAIGPAGGGNYVRIDSGYVDQSVAVTLPARAPGATGQAGILANVTPDWNTNLLYVGLDPTGKIEVWTLTGATWSASPIYSQVTDKTGATAHTIEARTIGGNLTVLIDGVGQLGPVAVPAAPADATFAGLFVDTTEPQANWPHYDDFQAAPAV